MHNERSKVRLTLQGPPELKSTDPVPASNTSHCRPWLLRPNVALTTSFLFLDEDALEPRVSAWYFPSCCPLFSALEDVAFVMFPWPSGEAKVQEPWSLTLLELSELLVGEDGLSTPPFREEASARERRCHSQQEIILLRCPE